MRNWLPAAMVIALVACSDEAPSQPEAEATEIPAELAGEPLSLPGDAGGEQGAQIGTPMDQRVATIGLINKRNNISRDIEMKPGESRRIGDVILRLSACERTAPWEEPQEIGAFVQVLVNDRPDADAEAVWMRVFSGWLFKNSPSLNVVEHPVYDVWVKDCAMSFPGEDEALPNLRSPAPAASAAPVAAEDAAAAPAAPDASSSSEE